MSPSATFLRLAGVASAISALTTLVIIFGPSLFSPMPEGLEGRMGRVTDPTYQFRAYVQLVHPLLALTAALGVGWLLTRRSSALALGGALGFFAWALVELVQQAMTLVAYDRWRVAWLAGDPAVRATIDLRLAVYSGLWDALYVALLIGFLLGCACYGAATARLTGLARLIGLLYLAAAVLTVSLLSRELAGVGLPAIIEQWMYPVVQPLARLLIGVWLWREARRPA